MEMRMDDGRTAPNSGSFVQERSTKPMKEVSAAAEAGATNNKAVAVKVEAGATKNKRRTKTMRVQQAYIDSLLEEYPFKAFPTVDVENSKVLDPEDKEIVCRSLNSAFAILKASRDKDEAIIKQYLALGYAEEEVEIEDDEEA